MPAERYFASDNNSPVNAEVMEALHQVNSNHQIAYGDDPYTERGIDMLRETFGENTHPFFVYNGTGANVTALSALLQPYQSVICPETAHINMDECGSLERFCGCKIIPVPGKNGKIGVNDIRHHLSEIGNEHASQPKAVSISQTTEFSTVYTPDEVNVLADFLHSNGLYLHMDGARLSNAAAALDVNLADITSIAGVDVLSFGCTKNGVMFGEAVLFFGTACAEWYKFVRKQGMQLASKMRYIAAQYTAVLENNLWYTNAVKANKMAALLASRISDLPGIRIEYPVEANGVFVSVPPRIIEPLKEMYPFYIWDHQKNIIRLMCSFDTTREDVEGFIRYLKGILNQAAESTGGK
ncbi:MAG: threonine aldolase family protein [Spirochaetia bacterium]